MTLIVPAAPPLADPVPLCVDLDGTLLRTDTLHELFLVLLKVRPLSLLMIPAWLMKGRGNLKQELAKRADLEVSLLPINEPFLEFLEHERAGGRKLVLVTGADRHIADAMAARIPIFSEVLSSDGKVNLTGTRKAGVLEERFGLRKFDYAGNERRDLKIWASSRKAVVVGASLRVAGEAKKLCEVAAVFPKPEAGLRTWVRAIRAHQWCKNLLLAIPVLGAHRHDWPTLRNLALAFAAFSLCASSVYMLNDLLDLAADRHHPAKRYRPFASGRISLAYGMLAVPLFLITSLVVTFTFLPNDFIYAFIAYYAMTVLYSWVLKQVAILDVFVLTALYGIRLLAGSCATGTAISDWLLVFSFFFFLSVAFAKRFTELRLVAPGVGGHLRNRGYRGSDVELISSMGVGSGYLAVLVLALYITGPAVTQLYHRPAALWAACPVLLYWLSRVWLLAHRGELHNDPIVFALKDRHSWVLLGILLLIGLAALPK